MTSWQPTYVNNGDGRSAHKIWVHATSDEKLLSDDAWPDRRPDKVIFLHDGEVVGGRVTVIDVDEWDGTIPEAPQ